MGSVRLRRRGKAHYKWRPETEALEIPPQNVAVSLYATLKPYGKVLSVRNVSPYRSFS